MLRVPSGGSRSSPLGFGGIGLVVTMVCDGIFMVKCIGTST